MEIDSRLAWAAATAAYRILNYTYKPNRVSDNSNAALMLKLLVSKEQQEKITPEDFEKGDEYREYCQKVFTFDVLSGLVKEGDFFYNLLSIANANVISSKFEINTLACAPNVVEREKKTREVKQKISFSSGEPLGNTGEVVTATVQILSSKFVNRYNCFAINAITDDNKALFFFTGKSYFEIGKHFTIQGKVKTHKDNQTQLNYVKELV